MPGVEMDFPTAVQLLLWISQNNDMKTAVQGAAEVRIRADPLWKSWKRQRTLLRHAPHFQGYRSSKTCDLYHQAARAVLGGGPPVPTAAQLAMFNGLMGEIGTSAVVLPAGQILFHGRADRDLDSLPVYPAFVSTSADPVVACNHANKRGFNSGGRALVYQLTLLTSRPAFFGDGGGLRECELLLPAGLSVKATNFHKGADFDIVEAEVQ